MFFNQETKASQQETLLEKTIRALKQPDADIDQIINYAYKHTEHADRVALYHQLSRRFHSDKNPTLKNKKEEIQQKLNNMNRACQSPYAYYNEVFLPLCNKIFKTSDEAPENFEDLVKKIHTMTESVLVYLGPSSLVLTKHHEYPKPFNNVFGWIAFAISLSLSLTWLTTAHILPLPLTIGNYLLKSINDKFIAVLDPTYPKRATKIKELNTEKHITLAEKGESSLKLSDEELRRNFNERFHLESKQTLDDNFYNNYLYSNLSKLENETRRQNFLASNTRGIHDQNGYDLVLRSELPNNDENQAKAGKIYLSSEDGGKYIVRDTSGNIQQGALEGIDLTQLAQTISAPEFKKTILEMTSKRGHTQKDELHIDNIPLEDLYAYVRESESNLIDSVPISTYQNLCLILGSYQHLLSIPKGFHEQTYQEQATHVLKQCLLLMTLSIVYLPMALSNLLINNLLEAYCFILMSTAWHTKLASAYLLSSPLYIMEALSPAPEEQATTEETEEKYLHMGIS